MKINNSDIDKNTRKLFQNTGLDEPSESFTYKVMKQVEKKKSYGRGMNENLWQILLAVGLPVLYFLFQLYSEGNLALDQMVGGITSSSYFEFVRIISDNLIKDISLSPIVFMGILAIMLLLVFDRLIIRMLQSDK